MHQRLGMIIKKQQENQSHPSKRLHNLWCTVFVQRFMHSVYAWHRRARFIKNSTFPFPSFATIILYDYYPQYKKKTKNKITLQCYPIYIGGGVDFSEAVKRRRIATFGRFIGDPLGRKWRIYSYAHQAWHDIHVCLLLWRSVLDGAKKKKFWINPIKCERKLTTHGGIYAPVMSHLNHDEWGPVTRICSSSLSRQIAIVPHFTSGFYLKKNEFHLKCFQVALFFYCPSSLPDDAPPNMVSISWLHAIG